jgi:tRNA(Ile)-lysidine synthase
MKTPDRVELGFRRAAQRLIPDGSSVLAAVSGGGDSVALLHLLVRYARGGRVRIAVAHLDHALRRGSVADRRFVERLAAELELECVFDRRPVAKLRRKDESPEEAARRVRRAFLVETSRRTGADLIATGHHLDDQAETILMRLARGAGPSSLAGMAESGPGPFVRPLLGIERSELRDYLGRRGLPFREDPSNRDLSFDRNRVRRLVLPVLAEALNPRAARRLVDSVGRLREDAAHLDDLANALYRRGKRRLPEGRLRISVRTVVEAPAPLARRIARLALADAGSDPRRIAARHVAAVLRLADGPPGKSVDLPHRIRATRRPRSIIFEPSG